MCSATLDGKLAPGADASSRPFLDRIPDHYADQLGELRETVDGVVVGNRTIQLDDSRLLPPSGEELVRVVPDPEALLDPTCTVLADDHPTTIAVTEATPDDHVDEIAAIDRKDVVIAGTDDLDLDRLLGTLGERGVDHLLLEGGGRLIYHFLDGEHVDEFRQLVVPYFVGDADAASVADGPETLFPDVRLDVERRDQLGDYLLVEGQVVYDET